MTNPMNADIEKELAEPWKRMEGILRDAYWTDSRHAESGTLGGLTVALRMAFDSALLAEAGERAKLEAERDDWKRKFYELTPEDIREMAWNENAILKGFLSGARANAADEAKRARGLEAQLETARAEILKLAKIVHAGRFHQWRKFEICKDGECKATRKLLAALSQLPTPAEPQQT